MEGLSRLLASRRVSPEQLADVADEMRTWSRSRDETRKATGRLLRRVLQAQISGGRRWCANCLGLSPDEDLQLCGGCKEVGYCQQSELEIKLHGSKNVCQAAHWKARHKHECKAWKAEREARLASGRDAKAGGGAGMQTGAGCRGAGGAWGASAGSDEKRSGRKKGGKKGKRGKGGRKR